MTIACPDCGTLEDLPVLSLHRKAVCALCDADLELVTGRSVNAAFACALAAFLLLFPSNLLPLMRVSMFGLHTSNVIAGGVFMLWNNGWVLLAALTFAFVVILPFIVYGLMALTLGTILLGQRPFWLGTLFGLAMRLERWAMFDVYLLASFVGFYRLINVEQMHVSVAIGGECFVAAAFLTMLTRAVLDRRTVWRAIGPEAQVRDDEDVISCTVCDLVVPASREGTNCPRCSTMLYARKPNSLVFTTALLVASFILFFPSNIYPMNVSVQIGTVHSYTIFEGVRDLFEAHLWPLGAVIFCTSIAIPIGKIIALGWCVHSVRRRSNRHLVAKTKVFRFVAEVGRWSKTDPYTIVFFVPLMNFQGLASANADWGATAFVAMTFLTMLAAYTFDPRLMWDAARDDIR